MSNHFKTQVEIADTYGVTRPAVHKWLEHPTFPKKDQHGWNKDAVNAWVAAKNERQIAKAEASGDKEEKVRLECERLRAVIQREQENVKQAKVETERAERRRESEIKKWASGWMTAKAHNCKRRFISLSEHLIAKHPKHLDLIKHITEEYSEIVRQEYTDTGE